LREVALAEAEALRRRHPRVLDPPYRGRAVAAALGLGMLALAAYGHWRLEFSFARFGSGIAQLAHIATLMFPPSPGTQLALYLRSLAETLAIALLGTLTAAVFAFPLGFLAAKNVIPNVFAHFAVRRLLDTIRGVDVLIWALIFINVVGLGPFAGILAIAASDIGSFGKLFSEAIENSDRRPVEGVIATGGSRLHVVRFGLIPQSFPVIASQVLYYRIEHALRDDHRHRRGGRHRPAPVGADPRAGMEQGLFPCAHDPADGRGDRLDLEPAALRHHRAQRGRGRVTARQAGDDPSTTKATRSAANRARVVSTGSPRRSTSSLFTSRIGLPGRRSSDCASATLAIAATMRVLARR
jgi:phosphonate transport system permease protein